MTSTIAFVGGAAVKLSVLPLIVYAPEPPIEACLTPSTNTTIDVTEAGVLDSVNAVVTLSPVKTSVTNDVDCNWFPIIDIVFYLFVLID
jgi:hypothetical protein